MWESSVIVVAVVAIVSALSSFCHSITLCRHRGSITTTLPLSVQPCSFINLNVCLVIVASIVNSYNHGCRCLCRHCGSTGRSAAPSQPAGYEKCRPQAFPRREQGAHHIQRATNSVDALLQLGIPSLPMRHSRKTPHAWALMTEHCCPLPRPASPSAGSYKSRPVAGPHGRR